MKLDNRIVAIISLLIGGIIGFSVAASNSYNIVLADIKQHRQNEADLQKTIGMDFLTEVTRAK